jgi:EAL domain-containing protein (putative c-di-GMP-specific phosphodiesterase class I)
VNPFLDDEYDRPDPLTSAADAATVASRDAETAAESAAETSVAAREAARSSADVAMHARVATATAVAAAAASTAKLAARTAAAVEAAAVTRAVDVATSAVEARETVASELPHDADPADARQAAAAVAATVAAEVVARAEATAQAAFLVAEAVTTAAEAAFLAAQSAASIVELAATTAAASGRAVAASSAQTQAATDVVVGSIGRVADLGPRLREVAAQRRVSLARAHPLVAELQGALARTELRLHYQAIHDLRTGAVSGVEALLRWQHPARGLLAPADFLDVAENHPDLVHPIGDWVLGEAISQASSWQHSYGGNAPKVWINIAGNQLGQQHLPGVVERLLTAAGLAPTAIGMEVTERQLIRRAEDAPSDLADLRDLGVSLAVDDFGTGYASLDYLRKFAFDEIKIDKTFVSGLGRDKTDTAVTSSIIALGRSLDLNVVAEGVETHNQYTALKHLGCAMCQGYLLHRPAPPDTIGELVAAQSTPAGAPD